MSIYSDIEPRYFSWLCAKIDLDGSYSKLLSQLYYEEIFVPMVERDENRAADGINLRYRYAVELDIPYAVVANKIDHKDCSVLEMMVALAVKCEEEITYNYELGDRTANWFWDMIKSLGLYDYDDWHYNSIEVNTIIKNFISRRYSPDGHGGLFTIKNYPGDLRTVEIWYQMCWYLNSIAS